MIDDDEDIAMALDDAREYLIEQARRDELLRQIDDLKRTDGLSITPLHMPLYDTGAPPSCGSTAMAAVTGMPISVINEAIRRAYPVFGKTDGTLLLAMELLGFYVVEEWSRGGVRYKLDRFAKEHGRDGPFIVAVTEHYLAISNGDFCDSITMATCDLFGGVLNQPSWRGKRLGSKWVWHWWRFARLKPPQES
jgi:hypothetical protein